MLVSDHIASEVAAEDLFSCQRAVKSRPKSAQARFDLARASLAADDPAEAVEQSAKALELQPRLRDAAWFLASLVQRYEVNENIKFSAGGLRAAFQFIDVDRQALSKAAIASLKHLSPLMNAIARGRVKGWDSAAQSLLKGKGRKLLQDKLFRAALSYGVNTDVEVEFLLTALRRTLLSAPELLQVRTVYEFACILIQQCVNNGYVFYATDEERTNLDLLQVDPEALFEGRAGSANGIILSGLYKPLSTLITPTLASYGYDRIVPRVLRPIIANTMAREQEESEIAISLPQLTGVTDEISKRVAAQYRGAPYPRWLSLQVPGSGTARRVLENYFSDEETNHLEKPFDVLIAGAGTCQQAVHSAIAYGQQARVLAIDLSAPSLAYGVRMAKKLSVQNIRFATSDILRIGEIDEMFDVIECAGVLHHMAAPYAAWKILTKKLKLGGLMQIGLYSDVSRQIIAKLSKDADWPGSDASDDALRTYRNSLMQRTPGEPGSELTASIDFFSTTDFRDLALHVQEQRCTLPDICNFLTSNGLDFRGFILPPSVHQSYVDMFPEDNMPGSLDHWWEFEQCHPRTFDGMYMFWCRRPGTKS